ncbi:MAG: ribonuclease HI family protein [Chloroflexi bacterium]|nr:ribonuclease HI family protein [Chloroflexota bacterium]
MSEFDQDEQVRSVQILRASMAEAVASVFVDASSQAGRTGVGMVLRGRSGELLGWAAQALRGMTNNEAEYAAVVFGLEQARRLKVRRLRVYSDSRVVVEQMRREIDVRNAALRKWNGRAWRAASEFDQVVYVYVPREFNQLADALADDVLHRTELARMIGGG